MYSEIIRLINLHRIKNPEEGEAGFTLNELSIVLVIIGLIVGGVLVGRDLIASATIRKQITQFQDYPSMAINDAVGMIAADSSYYAMVCLIVANANMTLPSKRLCARWRINCSNP